MIVQADAIAPQAWKNGGGITRDLLSGAGWRLSLADIDRDGAFSPYPGVQRCFAVVRGGGVELAFAGGARQLRVGDAPLVFDGADAPFCRLLAGPTRDLNLLLQGCRGAMQQVQPGVAWAADWPLRGRFDLATLALHWALPAGPLVAHAAGLWIGIAP